MRPSDYARKVIPLGSLIVHANDCRSRVYRVHAWYDPSDDEFFPVCLAYRDGNYVRISFINVLPWQNCQVPEAPSAGKVCGSASTRADQVEMLRKLFPKRDEKTVKGAWFTLSTVKKPPPVTGCSRIWPLRFEELLCTSTDQIDYPHSKIFTWQG